MTKIKLLAVLCWIFLFGCNDQPPEFEETTQDVILSAPAELIALDNATIGPPLIGRMSQFKIQKILPENTQVKKGEVVIVFDGDRLKNDLIGRRSQLNAEIKRKETDRLNDESKKQDLVLALAEAEMNFDIAKRKVEITDISRSEIEKKLQQADFLYQKEKLAQAKQKLAHHEEVMLVNEQVATGRVKKIQQRVDSTSDEIEKLKIKAPKDGLVMYLPDHNGEKPAVGETVYMGRSLMQLPSLDRLALKAEFSEPDSAKLHIGQSVKVLFDAYPEMSYMGTIEQLGQAFYPKSVRNPRVVFEVDIKLGDVRPDEMRPGMKAKIEVIKS